MTYDQALAYLYSFADFERHDSREAARFDLRRVHHILDRLGNPHLGRLTVHIAGTKGKGSTAAFLAAILQTAGYRTGLLTSPHLCVFPERIRLDGSMIPETALPPLIARLEPEVERYHRDPAWGTLTTFELVTLAAFMYFAECGATAQVLETGLGGRLDATNVVPNPDVCVITPISLDHTEVLGNTIAAIATEKAGIVKPGTPVVSAPQLPDASEVIRTRCRAQGDRLVDVGRVASTRLFSRDLDGQHFEITTCNRRYDLFTTLLGDVQLENAATAVVAAEQLPLGADERAAHAIVGGIASARWPGRLEVLSHDPLVIADGAQNAASAERLSDALGTLSRRRAILVVGTSKDKDVGAMASALAPVADRAIAVRSENPRSAPMHAVAAAFAAAGMTVEPGGSTAEGIRRAIEIAGPDGLVCITGSLFVVGEALTHFGRNPDGLQVYVPPSAAPATEGETGALLRSIT
ncbi:MAG: bifunctional folylpolyglutamate synthase/dihydrofolate synthase [Dehalococcoidia bacterium]|nr:bifunctional folylpolyglutamate synthase/dihydrofolate synthase [Dehalococcoidia bacterium]